MTHDLVVVTADFWSSGSLEESCVSPIDLDPTPTQRRGVHPIDRGWLVQLDEGVRVQPVAAWTMAPIDHDDLGVGMLKQGVDEPHSECARTDHEVVGLHVHPRLSHKRSLHAGNYGMSLGDPYWQSNQRHREDSDGPCGLKAQIGPREPTGWTGWTAQTGLRSGGAGSSPAGGALRFTWSEVLSRKVPSLGRRVWQSMPAIRNATSESEREERPRRDTCRSGSYRPGGCTPSSEKAAMNENGTPRRPSTVRRRTPALLWRRSSRTPRRRARRRRAESITISQTLGKWLDRRHHDAPERYPTSNVQGTPLVSPSSN